MDKFERKKKWWLDGSVGVSFKGLKDTDFEKCNLKMIMHAARMVCEQILSEADHRTPGPSHDMARLLLERIDEEISDAGCSKRK